MIKGGLAYNQFSNIVGVALICENVNSSKLGNVRVFFIFQIYSDTLLWMARKIVPGERCYIGLCSEPLDKQVSGQRFTVAFNLTFSSLRKSLRK